MTCPWFSLFGFLASGMVKGYLRKHPEGTWHRVPGPGACLDFDSLADWAKHDQFQATLVRWTPPDP